MKRLQDLEAEYEKVLVWFEPNMDRRLENICKVVKEGEQVSFDRTSSNKGSKF